MKVSLGNEKSKQGHCGIKSNGIDYSHHVCVWPSEEEKEECEFVDSLYVSRGNLHMRRGYKKTKLARQSVILKAESRHWVKRSWRELWSSVILKAENRHWVKRSWRESLSCVILIVGVKEFRPLFSLQSFTEIFLIPKWYLYQKNKVLKKIGLGLPLAHF